MIHHEQLNLIPLVHRPLHAPRAGHIGELVFASMWEVRMAIPEKPPGADEEVPYLDVLDNFLGQITQRQATAVASVVCWLGTNCGAAMLTRAQRERDAGHWEAWHAYLIAWTLENHRRRSTNYGVRAIEYMMAPAETVRPGEALGDSGLSELPTLGADELEAVDHLMVWLADRDGQDFLRICQTEIDRLSLEHTLAQRARWLRASWAAPETTA